MSTTIDYPTDLPKALIATLQHSSSDVFIDDAASVGSARRRARFTRVLDSFQFVSRMTDAQWQALQAFYKTALSNGVLTFNWTHPLSDIAYEVRFVGAPSAKMLAAHLYDVSISLEQI